MTPPTAQPDKLPEEISLGNIFIIMGVSGCGKSTLAALLAHKLNCEYRDADDMHPPANVQKMSAGEPLNDIDRGPWLQKICTYTMQQANKGHTIVIACSALKHAYRDVLNQAGAVQYVFLAGSKKIIAERMQSRAGHYMPESLLDSQINTLEDPSNEANVVTVQIDSTPQAILEKTLYLLKLF